MNPGDKVLCWGTVFHDPSGAPVILVQFRGANGLLGPATPIKRDDVEAEPPSATPA